MGRISCQTPGEEAERILDKRKPMPSSQSYIYIKPRQPVKEKILSEGTRQKAKYCNYIFSLSLPQFKERRQKRKRKKDIYIYVLSADNIADTVNMCVRVYIKKTLSYFNVPTCLFIVLSACQVVYFMFVFSFVRLMLFSPKLSYSFLQNYYTGNRNCWLL